jgi:uncharacterized membrane protein
MVPGGRVIAGQIKSHSGPLPAPEDFGTYEAILPGAAARILAMAEADAEHFRELDRKAVAQDIWEGRAARLPVPGLAVAGLLAAVVIVALGGSAWVAGPIGVAALSAPVIGAILRRG